jgi:hypothetical protein
MNSISLSKFINRSFLSTRNYSLTTIRSDVNTDSSLDRNSKKFKATLGKLGKRDKKKQIESISFKLIELQNKVIKEKGFEIIDILGNASVQLKKKENNIEIIVDFDSFSPSSLDPDEQTLSDQNVFDILIRNTDIENNNSNNENSDIMTSSSSFLVFTCVAYPDIEPMSVRIVPIPDDVPDPLPMNIINELVFDQGIYDGPDISVGMPRHNQKMKSSLLSYLNSFGIDDSLSEFVYQYSRLKHFKEKNNALENIQKWISE